MSLLSILLAVLEGAWETFFLAAPFVLFGLFVAGVLHVLISRRAVERWMGKGGLGAVSKAAAFGVPLPICSCGIVPVSIELKRKGASRPANLSFLITTPESSADAIFLTWAMLGPVMAIARPVASFFTALIAGVLAIAEKAGLRREDSDDQPLDEAVLADSGVHLHDHHTESAAEEETLGWSGLWRALRRRDGATLRTAGRKVGHYAFVEMLDDIAFWLIVGFLLAGVIVAVVPDDLAAGGGLVPMLILLVAGIPLYMCASASTPVGAALVAKGVSPGAAMVFLLAGPATNAASLVLLLQHFGRRFVRIYLVSIAAGALVTGLVLDFLLGVAGWNVVARLTAETEGWVGFLHTASVVVFGLLLVWRLFAGAFRQGMHEAADNLRGARAFVASRWPKLRLRHLVAAAVAAVALFWLSIGVAVIPPDSAGFRVLFGRAARQPLPPGLHFGAPVPFGRIDVWRVDYPRKADVGFRTDLEAIAQRREISLFANPNEWHSPVAAMNSRPLEAGYLTGDENLLEMTFTVHYGLDEPYRFFYAMDQRRDFVALYARSVARHEVASRTLDALLTEDRPVVEQRLRDRLQESLDAIDSGVRVNSVHVVDLHPPQEVVAAFRDVSSANEDRASRILRAEEMREQEVPRARGQGLLERAAAAAAAEGRATEAAGAAESFTARAGALAGDRSLLTHLLWIESAERVLAGRPKVVLPPGTGGGSIGLWRGADGPRPNRSPAPQKKPFDREIDHP
ncbi:MAG: SO_0444 family Cu/Zn efflux transporter [Acidobacteriota bacterium]